MTTYTAPGVYVEEVPSGARPIAAVGTSTAGFVGSWSEHVPTTTITHWGEFVDAFADISASNEVLAHAVYGFFDNGGSRCHVAGATSIEELDDALGEFEAIDEIAIVVAPWSTTEELTTVHEKLIGHCSAMGDRFAILDCAEGATGDPADINKPPENPGGHGAFYFPWIQVGARGGGDVMVPPSGHVAGVYARSDAQRGVHKAPANEAILGARGLAVPVSRSMQAALNPLGVNCIRMFSGTAKVYGARTVGAQDGQWRYISTRRLVDNLRESIQDGMQWVVFEPNTEALWATIQRNVSAFLLGVWGSGALFGSKPEEAFFVRCDRTLNPPSVRELGQVIVEVGVAIAKPAEFVVFRLSQWTGEGS